MGTTLLVAIGLALLFHLPHPLYVGLAVLAVAAVTPETAKGRAH